jgi:hypothetical protein
VSDSSKPATDSLVIDFLAESRFARHRRRKQESKSYTTCQKCGKDLVSKWGTLRGTNNITKAVCKECKSAPKGCQHPRLRSFTFSDGQTIKLCPDCTKFDGKRYSVLNNGKTKPAGNANKTIVKRLRFDTRKYKPHMLGSREHWAHDFPTLTDYVVVPLSRTRLKGAMSEWQELRDERDYLRLYWVYEFPKDVDTITPHHWCCVCKDCEAKRE